MRPLTSLGAAFLASLLFTNFASADTATLHTTTTQMPGAACSVTAWHRFATVNGRYTMLYGGGTSCAGGSGQFTIDVVPQVFNRVNGQPLWFNISGAGLFQGPTAAAPLRLSASRAAVKGHVYRVLVYARATAPNGRTVSATSNSAPDGTHPTLSIIPSRPINPTPWTTARLPGIDASVTVSGPTFVSINGTDVMQYTGRLSTGPGVTGHATLRIGAQVLGSWTVYYTVTGSTMSVSTGSAAAAGPLSLATARTAYLGHGYRVFAAAEVSVGARTITATAMSSTSAP